MDHSSSPIPIVFSSNDYFVPYMAAMIQSIMENACVDRKFQLYILHKDISSLNTELLKKQTNTFSNFSIDFINISEYFKEYSLYVSRGIPLEAYFRLLIPELFSKYEKVIYLDGDMICCTNIVELYETDISNYLIASSRDIPIIIDYYKKENKDLPNLKKPENYFISGMLIFNIKPFAEVLSARELLDFAAKNNFEYHDQDVLNIKCEGKTLLLPLEWDFTPSNGIDILPGYIQEEYRNAEKNPKIVHFAGPDHKPWENFINVPYFELFWKYATRTPFIDIIINRMKEKDLIGFTYREHVSFDIEHKRFLGMRLILKSFFRRYLKNKKV